MCRKKRDTLVLSSFYGFSQELRVLGDQVRLVYFEAFSIGGGMVSNSKQSGLLLTLFCAVLLTPRVEAIAITYEQLSQSGNYYEYGYTVTNTSSFYVEEFSIYYQVGSYQNLQVLSSPTDWDPLVLQPSFLFDGLIDWLALGDLIAPGETLGGFNIAFDWVGVGSSPSERQFFEVYDPSTFDVLADGETSKAKASVSVPEPMVWILVLGGLLVLGFMRQYRNR